jgi:tungstate transport system ATP-binding protein
MDELIYRIENLKKQYGQRTVVDVEQLGVRAGEILAIVGPSGAGKSTLLRLLNFLEGPTSGLLVYRGQRAGNGGFPLALRREVTTVFQHSILLGGDVYSNVAYGLRLRRWHVNSQAKEMLTRVGLAEMMRASARKLSGGEIQRVALARALVIEPTVLLLDEPTANLDPYNVGLIEDIVRQQNRDRRTTVILVTHNVFQAKRLASRVGLMLAGRLVEVTDNRTFFETPSDPRTAAFVRGDMIC